MPVSAVERLFDTTLADSSPENMRLFFIQAARQGIKEFISRQVEPIPYTIEVNGATVSSEDAVPIGPSRITYVLQRFPQVARYALDLARSLSPQGPTGRYKGAWFLLVDNAEINQNRIPNNVKEVILVNDEPYSRKIHVRGARIQGIPPGIIERVRQLVLRRYEGFVTATLEFHTLRGGYILKRNTRRHRAGEQMTYPTLVMRSRV